MSRVFGTNFLIILTGLVPQELKFRVLLRSVVGLHQPFSCVVDCVPNNINNPYNEGITDYGRRSTITRNTLQ
jgi:hypothetical protein